MLSRLKYLFIIPFLVLSCKQEMKVIETYESGQIKLKCEIKDKLFHGKCIEYSENGKKLALYNYEDGKIGGESRFYHLNGALHWSAQFSNGLRNGEVDYFDSLGIRYRKVNLVDDLLNGVSSDYYSNGKVKSRSSFVNGKRSGKSDYYSDDGKIRYSQFYEDDKLVAFQQFDSLGNILGQSMNYEVKHKISNGEKVAISIEITNPILDQQALQLFEINNDSDTSLVIGTYYADDGMIEFDLEYSQELETIELRGELLGLEGFLTKDGSNGGVVKTSQFFYFSFNNEVDTKL